MSVCLSVCLSVRSHISKITCSNFTKFYVYVKRGRGSVLLRFRGWLMFHIMELMSQNRIWRVVLCFVERWHRGKVAIYNCKLIFKGVHKTNFKIKLLLSTISPQFRDDRTSALYNVGSGSWLARANGAAAQFAAIQLHALTYNWTRVM